MAELGDQADAAFLSLSSFAGWKVTNSMRDNLAGNEPDSAEEPSIAHNAGVDRLLTRITSQLQRAGGNINNDAARPILAHVRALREATSPEQFDDVILEQSFDQYGGELGDF